MKGISKTALYRKFLKEERPEKYKQLLQREKERAERNKEEREKRWSLGTRRAEMEKEKFLSHKRQQGRKYYSQKKTGVVRQTRHMTEVASTTSQEHKGKRRVDMSVEERRAYDTEQRRKRRMARTPQVLLMDDQLLPEMEGEKDQKPVPVMLLINRAAHEQRRDDEQSMQEEGLVEVKIEQDTSNSGGDFDVNPATYYENVVDFPVMEVKSAAIGDLTELSSEESDVTEDLTEIPSPPSDVKMRKEPPSKQTDVVKELKELPFEEGDMHQRLGILLSGKPTPALKFKPNKQHLFTKEHYNAYDWLCGSTFYNAYFCWPCLLFSPNSENRWTRNGYTHLHYLQSGVSKHVREMEHLYSYKRYMEHFRSSTNSEVAQKEKQHNAHVAENRVRLKHLANVVLYLCQQELFPCYCNDRKCDIRKRNYSELLKSFAKIDWIVAARFREDSSETSRMMQDSIVSAIDNVIINKMNQDVDEVKFFSVQADVVMDCKTHSQFSIIIRYVLGYKVHEQFVGFFIFKERGDSRWFCEVIRMALASFKGAKRKLISLTFDFDGGCVKAGELKTVQKDMKSIGFPFPYFIHCHAHNLASTLGQIVENVKGVRIFLSQLRTFMEFASSSVKLGSVFEDVDSVPSQHEIYFCNTLKAVVSIKCNLKFLKFDLREILDNGEWDGDTLNGADYQLGKLYDFAFIFFINCFHVFLPLAMTRLELNLDMDMSQVYGFIDYLEKYRSDEHFEKIAQITRDDIIAHQGDDTESNAQKHSPPTKKFKRNEDVDFKGMYFEILDSMLLALRERFNYVKEATYFSLLDVRKFEMFKDSFPTDQIENLKETYPGLFDTETLTQELKFLYDDKDFLACDSVQTLLQTIHRMGLNTALSETVKLIRLVLTLPLMPVATEQSASTLDNIHTYLSRRTCHQPPSSTLARISINKEILEEMDIKESLHQNILEEFAIKPGRQEYIF